VLGLGLATGMAAEYTASGQLLAFDHKTILSLLTFLVIGVLLFAHFKTGMRGRKVARIVLLAYLMLTLGYLGVKVVTGVFLA
ncbi:cytochrome c biogenesis protein CcsA, partial [Pseudomonadota bacterium]